MFWIIYNYTWFKINYIKINYNYLKFHASPPHHFYILILFLMVLIKSYCHLLILASVPSQCYHQSPQNLQSLEDSTEHSLFSLDSYVELSLSKNILPRFQKTFSIGKIQRQMCFHRLS